MSSPAGSIRQRAGKDKKRPVSPNPEALSEKVANVVEKGKPYKPAQQGNEWDYKLAITIMTALAFVTRFWGIRHPDQVVFDEVHFGKVCVFMMSFLRVVGAGCTLTARLIVSTVRFLLPATYLLLRCTPSSRETSFCARWLARRIQR